MPATATRRHLIAAAGALASGPAWAQTARPRVRLTTDKGVIMVELADDKAPITVANFLRYVDTGRMDGVGSSRVDLQACKLEYSIVSPK